MLGCSKCAGRGVGHCPWPPEGSTHPGAVTPDTSPTSASTRDRRKLRTLETSTGAMLLYNIDFIAKETPRPPAPGPAHTRRPSSSGTSSSRAAAPAGPAATAATANARHADASSTRSARTTAHPTRRPAPTASAPRRPATRRADPSRSPGTRPAPQHPEATLPERRRRRQQQPHLLGQKTPPLLAFQRLPRQHPVRHRDSFRLGLDTPRRRPESR